MLGAGHRAASQLKRMSAHCTAWQATCAGGGHRPRGRPVLKCRSRAAVHCRVTIGVARLVAGGRVKRALLDVHAPHLHLRTRTSYIDAFVSVEATATHHGGHRHCPYLGRHHLLRDVWHFPTLPLPYAPRSAHLFDAAAPGESSPNCRTSRLHQYLLRGKLIAYLLSCSRTRQPGRDRG